MPEQRKSKNPWVRVRSSRIHGTGAFAAKPIPRNTRIVEYIGDKVTKAEADRRALKYSKIYMFELNKRYDIDGSVSRNLARFLNHSCRPNCEVSILRGHIWIIALRAIELGEELTYDYGYELKGYQDYPCRCGEPDCIGYVVEKAKWRAFQRRQKKKAEKKETATDLSKAVVVPN